MSHRSASDSPAMIVVKRALAGAALVAAGYFAALLASTSLIGPGTVAKGTASDATAVAASALAQKPSSPEAAADGRQRDFDYYPDHYTNQAREVADQPPTF